MASTSLDALWRQTTVKLRALLNEDTYDRWIAGIVPVALARNALRTASARIPDRAIWATAARLEPPSLAEGFHALYRATPAPEGGWMLTPLTDNP